MTLFLHQWRLSTWSQRRDKGNPDGWWYIYLFSKRNIYIENERTSISCPETEISKKFTLLHIKTNTDILFFISERWQQRLMKFCQKSKRKDVTAASGHLLCKFFRIQTIYTCMSEHHPQKRWVWSADHENEKFNLIIFNVFCLIRRQSKSFHLRFSETIKF